MKISRASFSRFVFSLGLTGIASRALPVSSYQHTGQASTFSQIQSPSQDFISSVSRQVANKSIGQLNELVIQEDSSVAIAAAWERVRKCGGNGDGLQSVAIGRFIGNIESRFVVSIPERWGLALLNATRNKQGRYTFKRIKSTIGVEMKIREAWRRADSIAVPYEGSILAVPIDKRSAGNTQVAICADSTNIFVCLHGGRPFPYSLVALNRMSGLTTWTADIWADCDRLDYEGVGWHMVEVVAANGIVAVFGIGDSIAYVEVFDSKTGENRMRFSTQNAEQ